MIRLACEIPRDVVVATSGGPDSMALLDFCIRGRKNVTVLHVDHGTPFGTTSREFVRDYCSLRGLSLVVRKVSDSPAHTEESWRNERLKIYSEFTSNIPVATGHHLDDAVEWYLMTALHGKPAYMKATDKKHGLIKPFLKTPKQLLTAWCDSKGVPYLIDPTNVGEDNVRARLRSKVLPELIQIHPGLRSSIRNRLD